MSILNDPLFEIFENHLFTSLVEEESHDEFVDKVIFEYIQTLTSTGRVPQNFVDDLEEDLREEILDMLRKKTYGFHTLKDYRQSMRDAGKIPRKVS